MRNVLLKLSSRWHFNAFNGMFQTLEISIQNQNRAVQNHSNRFFFFTWLLIMYLIFSCSCEVTRFFQNIKSKQLSVANRDICLLTEGNASQRTKMQCVSIRTMWRMLCLFNEFLLIFTVTNVIWSSQTLAHLFHTVYNFTSNTFAQ